MVARLLALLGHAVQAFSDNVRIGAKQQGLGGQGLPERSCWQTGPAERGTACSPGRQACLVPQVQGWDPFAASPQLAQYRRHPQHPTALTWGGGLSAVRVNLPQVDLLVGHVEQQVAVVICQGQAHDACALRDAQPRNLMI